MTFIDNEAFGRVLLLHFMKLGIITRLKTGQNSKFLRVGGTSAMTFITREAFGESSCFMFIFHEARNNHYYARLLLKSAIQTLSNEDFF